MPRPKLFRQIQEIPEITYFKPQGIPLRMLKEEKIAFEEIEAIRLKEIESLEQEECAKKMHISQPTFHRLLLSARKKIALALCEGKALRIEGGNFKIKKTKGENK